MGGALKRRRFGRTEIEIGALGLGTWALGGPWTAADGAHYPAGTAMGYGAQDDRESARVLDAALANGVRLIDTANLYGAGHAERLVGQAIRGRRDRAFVAARFGHTYDPARRAFTGIDTAPAAIEAALETTLRNLGSDHVDLFQLQVEFHDLGGIDAVFDTVERFIDQGKVRYTSWSTNYPARLQAIAGRDSVQSGQFDLNVFQDSPDMLEVCAAAGLTAIARLPLAMGFLSGRFTADTRLPPDDVRANAGAAPHRFWLRFFGPGGAARPEWTARLDAVREILTSGGRTPAQGALAWLFARAPTTVAIPGCRTVRQLEENLAALDHGPLTPDQMAEIERLLDRRADPSALILQPFRPAA